MDREMKIKSNTRDIQASAVANIIGIYQIFDWQHEFYGICKSTQFKVGKKTKYRNHHEFVCIKCGMTYYGKIMSY